MFYKRLLNVEESVHVIFKEINTCEPSQSDSFGELTLQELESTRLNSTDAQNGHSTNPQEERIVRSAV